MTFAITSVSPKLIVREVNPLGERPTYTPLIGGFEILVDNDRNRTFAERFNKWQEAEANLKEYELTEDSKYTGEQWVEYGYTTNGQRIPIHMNRVMRDFKISQHITGELILENGETKIKVI